METKDILEDAQWQEAEKRVAGRFGLTVSSASAGSVLRRLVEEETRLAEFSVDELHALLLQEPETVIRFGMRWYADCNKHEYGEEWNPEEGDQQDKDRESKVVGMSGGFLMGYTFLLLYARHKPELLTGYIKRRRIPHAARVAKDVQRVYAATLAAASNANGGT
jgi:hypothetical protein